MLWKEQLNGIGHLYGPGRRVRLTGPRWYWINLVGIGTFHKWLIQDAKVSQSWRGEIYQTCHSSLQGERSAQLHRWHHFDGQFGQVDCFIFLQKQREYHKEQRNAVVRKPVLNLKECSQSKLMVLFVTTKARRWTRHQIDPNLEAHGHTLNHQRDWNQSFKAKARENWSSN